MPLAADYTRFSRSRRAAFWGAARLPHPTLWLYALGVLLFSRIGTSPTRRSSRRVAAGGVGSRARALALAVDESDEAFANIYSTAVSLQNVVPRVPQRRADRRRRGARDGGALVIDLAQYSDVPLPARLVLRAALRRAARGLAGRGRALRPRATFRAGRPSARR